MRKPNIQLSMVILAGIGCFTVLIFVRFFFFFSFLFSSSLLFFFGTWNERIYGRAPVATLNDAVVNGSQDRLNGPIERVLALFFCRARIETRALTPRLIRAHNSVQRNILRWLRAVRSDRKEARCIILQPWRRGSLVASKTKFIPRTRSYRLVARVH